MAASKAELKVLYSAAQRAVPSAWKLAGKMVVEMV
jgi:hypothetical protein